MAQNKRVKRDDIWVSLCSFAECEEPRATPRQVGLRGYGELIFCMVHARKFDQGLLYPRQEKPLELRVFKS